MVKTPSANTLFYGDNLDILREHIDDESVDLVYLDPPFNSNATYNVLFKSPAGEESQAQIEAFDDTWHWNHSAERAYHEVLTSGNSDAANMLQAMRSFLGENDMMAYLAMMAVRLLELHRVLKPTGSLYLHCDPTASHYLKLILDSVFGPKNFVSEVIWRRTSSSNNPQRWGPVHDTILLYRKTSEFLWNKTFQAHDEAYLASKYKYDDERGRYRLSDLTASGTRTGDSGKPWRGFDPSTTGRHWGVPAAIVQALELGTGLTSQQKLDALDDNGFIYWTPGRKGKPGFPQLKRYLTGGQPIQDVVDDIPPINSMAKERLGYPTQKPVALLERMISASAPADGLVLDPFCGCGTTIHAAQKLGRRWVGIDVTHLAIGLIRRRLEDAFPMAHFEVLGVPKDLEAARALATADKHQFQLWALSMIDNAVPYKGGKKGADRGVDGYVYFQVPTESGAGNKTTTGKAIVSIKGGTNVSDTMVKDLITTVDHEGAQMGLFITLTPPTKPMVARAAAAGFYETPLRDFPRVQILTIEDLFDGKRPEMPWLDPSVFKKAKQEKQDTGQGDLGL